MSVRRALSLLLLFVVIAGAARAQDASPVAVIAKATPEKPTIGSPNRYEVDVVAPAGTEVVVAQPGERIGDLDIVDFGSEPPAETTDGNVTFRRWWQLVAGAPALTRSNRPRSPIGNLVPSWRRWRRSR